MRLILIWLLLTGASVVAVGNYEADQVMGFNDEVKDMVIQASKRGGEFMTKLDFNRYLKKSLKVQYR